jgi:hypothetical protein
MKVIKMQGNHPPRKEFLRDEGHKKARESSTYDWQQIKMIALLLH